MASLVALLLDYGARSIQVGPSLQAFSLRLIIRRASIEVRIWCALLYTLMLQLLVLVVRILPTACSAHSTPFAKGNLKPLVDYNELSSL